MRSHHQSRSESGQALIMVTVALLAMSGLIGMAVDFGWSYYMRRAAQSAADAAAMAAVGGAMDAVHSGGTTFSAALTSFSGNSAPLDCMGISSGYLQKACLYAAQNGFSSGGDSGRQTVTVASDTTSPPPTAPGVNVHCWVTVRITNIIPQLYSAILGNSNATISASATAAISDTVVQGAALGLNRENDAGPASPFPAGADVILTPGSRIVTDFTRSKGIVLSSNSTFSGTNNSTVVSQSAFTMSRGGLTSGTSNWPNPRPDQGDSQLYTDPMRDLGQPPLTKTPLNAYPVPGGTDWSRCPGYPTCGPGIYFATDANDHATGLPLTISSTSSPSGFSAGSGFGDYVFYGGLNVNSGVSFGAGRYVLAGVLNPASTLTQELNISTSSAIVDGSNGGGAGQLFILTRPDYPGLSAITQTAIQQGNYDPSNILGTLTFGQSTIGTGTTSTVLYGLNSTYLPSSANTTNSQGASLSDFGPVLIWQDQRFSNVPYTANGNINTSCSGSSCLNSTPVKPILNFGMSSSSATSNLHGVIYQPRGSWMQFQPNTLLQGPLQLISGAFDVGDCGSTPGCSGSGGAHLDLRDPGGDASSLWVTSTKPLTMRVVALVE